ncbi:acyl-CoA dehydrogenase family protein [Myxococcus sp. K15C18031901]|uniref:acyl-CoA dehydrogenase family protein n=1 Tax=Myxococcus dinghuensis TaxID=2906761 RepID=UPI0020A7B715|nr:acyl-CoA dehydrogenase family protein [Myxococcus dinghuensis]MCP3099429.1 acyl-CoA dehydrogenase family protein [Myxococcus dinghuensis]
MDFELSDTQRDAQQRARAFAERELAPHAARWDAEGTFPRDALTQAARLGYCGLYAESRQGGLGLGRLDATLVFEELAAACPSTAAYLTIHNMVAWVASRWADTEHASSWARRLTSGHSLASYCLSEPEAGSDAASLRTTATRDGNDYVLEGTKAFVSGSGVTEALLVIARTGASGAQGLTAFLIPASTRGIQLGPPEEKLGWRNQPTRTVHFERVRVPADLRLGQEGEGFRIAMQALDGERVNLAICSVGAAQAALDAARQHLHRRSQFNRKLAGFQSVQFKFAGMATDLVAARQMARLAASMLDSRSPQATVYCAMAKQVATDTGFRICNEALQLHGGYGYLRRYPLERYLRDTRVHQILGGTNEIMRVIVSRYLLDEVTAGGGDGL